MLGNIRLCELPFLLFDAIDNIGYAIFNLLLDIPDACLLFGGQIQVGI